MSGIAPDLSEIADVVLATAADADLLSYDVSTGTWQNADAAGSGVQPLDADLTALSALTGTGYVVRTGVDTYAERTIVGTADQLDVANGTGAGGNTTLSIPATLHIDGIVPRAGGAFTVTMGTGGGDDFKVITGSDPDLFVIEGNDSQIGVGTSAPIAKLHVVGNVMAAKVNGAPWLALRREDTSIGGANALGNLFFTGDDASSTNTPGCSIQGAGDGAWSSGDTPGRIVISTVPSGSEVLAERVRVHSTGDVGLGTTAVPSADGGKVLLFGDNAAHPTLPRDVAVLYGLTEAGPKTELWVQDDQGNTTKLSSHDDAGEFYLDSFNPFTGTGERIWVSRVARALQERHPDLTLIEDYTLPEGRILDWETVQSVRKQAADDALAIWDAATPDDRADTPRPNAYSVRPAPPFIREATEKRTSR